MAEPNPGSEPASCPKCGSTKLSVLSIGGDFRFFSPNPDRLLGSAEQPRDVAPSALLAGAFVTHGALWRHVRAIKELESFGVGHGWAPIGAYRADVIYPGTESTNRPLFCGEVQTNESGRCFAGGIPAMRVPASRGLQAQTEKQSFRYTAQSTWGDRRGVGRQSCA
jgi:hypothetical protein